MLWIECVMNNDDIIIKKINFNPNGWPPRLVDIDFNDKNNYEIEFKRYYINKRENPDPYDYTRNFDVPDFICSEFVKEKTCIHVSVGADCVDKIKMLSSVMDYRTQHGDINIYCLFYEVKCNKCEYCLGATTRFVYFKKDRESMLKYLNFYEKDKPKKQSFLRRLLGI